jgi:hypothetical protein
MEFDGDGNLLISSSIIPEQFPPGTREQSKSPKLCSFGL